MLHRGEQKRAEPAFGGIYLKEPFFSEQSREKLLNQVLGILGIATAPADESVKRIPVSLAKARERFRAARGTRMASEEDPGPMGRGKDGVAPRVHKRRLNKNQDRSRLWLYLPFRRCRLC